MRLTGAHTANRPVCYMQAGLCLFLEVISMVDILTMLAQFGFPAIMCFLIWDSNKKLEDKFTKLLETNTKALVSTAGALEELKAAIKEGNNGIS